MVVFKSVLQPAVLKQRGFTLVEVMVAMMIVALALPALLGQSQSLSQHVFVARAKTQAFWVAQNKLAETSINLRLNDELPPRKERDTISLGRDKWDWVLTTTETAENIYRIDVQVRRAGEDSNLAALSGFIRTGELIQSE